ncbi:MAG: PEP-CTERM sorting domain-containing protein [Deferribacteres bacterium]|nr:PEP-CTERM sorting domain-containing protein [Deferribacteres bacterium]
MKKLVIILSVVAMVFGTVAIAGATSVYFDIGKRNGIDSPGVSLNYDIYDTLSEVAFSLEEGQSTWFNYALINDVSGKSGTYDITAYLDFDLPGDILGANPVPNPGELRLTNNPTQCRNGCLKSKTVSIDFSPVDVPFGKDGLFTILLSNVDVTWKGKGCCKNGWQPQTITATITLKKAPTPPAPVPEPSTLLLLGSGILGTAVFLRKRRN